MNLFYREINKKLDKILENLERKILGEIDLSTTRVCEIHNDLICQPVYDINDEILLYNWCQVCGRKYAISS